jgi:hypothetical protein
MKIALLAVSLFTTYFLQTPSMTGKWAGLLKAPNGMLVQLIYDFQIKGENLTGSMQGPDGSGPITDGKMKDSVFSFSMAGLQTAYQSGKYYGDSIILNIALESGANFHLTLKRTE